MSSTGFQSPRRPRSPPGPSFLQHEGTSVRHVDEPHSDSQTPSITAPLLQATVIAPAPAASTTAESATSGGDAIGNTIAAGEGGDGQVADASKRHWARTVEELKEKRCWICFEDESGEEQGTGTDRWVHPCKCTLIAHEQCLLTWIAIRERTQPSSPTANPREQPIKCPQCSTPYTITQPSSAFLNTLDFARRHYDVCVNYAASCGILVSTGATLSVYGLWAARCFLGTDRWNLWLRHPQGFTVVRMMQLSLVGPVLVLSRTTFLDSALPFLPLSLVLASLPPPGSLADTALTLGEGEMDWSFPPSPSLTLCLIPWARLCWTWTWERFSGWIIDWETNRLRLTPGEHGQAIPTNTEGGFGFDFRFNFGGGGQRGVDAEPAPAAPGGSWGEGEREGEQAEAAPPNAVAAAAAPYALTLRRMLRSALSALFFPAFASFAGEILLLFARHSTLLQRVLGVRFFKPHHPSGGWIGAGTTAAAFGAVWSHALWTGSQGRKRGYEDPVWWRNALGGAAIVVVKDVLGLVEKVAGMRRVAGRRIGSVGFGEGLQVGEGRDL